MGRNEEVEDEEREKFVDHAEIIKFFVELFYNNAKNSRSQAFFSLSHALTHSHIRTPYLSVSLARTRTLAHTFSFCWSHTLSYIDFLGKYFFWLSKAIHILILVHANKTIQHHLSFSVEGGNPIAKKQPSLSLALALAHLLSTFELS